MKRLLSFILSLSVVISYFTICVPEVTTATAASKTGIGLAQWALRAYNERWSYVYGGATVGKVDCSGLVYSYAGGYHGAKKMTSNYASVSGKMSSMPRVHGLVLFAAPTASSSIAHMGVYVGKDANGNDMAIDARSSKTDVVYKTVSSRKSKPWTKWFKHSKLSYPTTGWYKFNGKTYYYHKGEFVVGKFKVNGVTYDFGKSGALKGQTSAPADNNKPQTDNGTLKYGSKGSNVLKLQNRLVSLGYLKGKQDGAYGNKTVEAVKNFQKRAGITADGVAGKKTLDKIYSSSAPKAASATKPTTVTKPTTTKPNVQSLKIGCKGNDVYKLQSRLSQLGYLKVKYDGTYGQITSNAVKAFQKKAGLTADGVAGKTTLEYLYSSGAPKADKSADKTTTTATTSTTTAVTTTTTSNTPDNSDTVGPLVASYDILRVGDESEAVEQLQLRLSELGFFDQEATGYFGTFTKDAVMSFQQFSNLSVDGIVGEDTFNAIFSDSATSRPGDYISDSFSSDEADGEDSEEGSSSGNAQTIYYKGECFIISEEVNTLIEKSVFI